MVELKKDLKKFNSVKKIHSWVMVELKKYNRI